MCLYPYIDDSLFGTATYPCYHASFPSFMLLFMPWCFYTWCHTPSLLWYLYLCCYASFSAIMLLNLLWYFSISCCCTPITSLVFLFLLDVPISAVMFSPDTMHQFLHWCIHTCIDVSIPELMHLLLLACLYPCSHVFIPSLVVLFSFEDSILAIMFLSKLSCLQPCIDAFIPALIILSLMSCSCLNNKSSIPGTTLVFKIWCIYICYDAFITALIPPLLIQGFYPCCDDTISVSISAIMHLSLFLWFY